MKKLLARIKAWFSPRPPAPKVVEVTPKKAWRDGWNAYHAGKHAVDNPFLINALGYKPSTPSNYFQEYLMFHGGDIFAYGNLETPKRILKNPEYRGPLAAAWHQGYGEALWAQLLEDHKRDHPQ